MKLQNFTKIDTELLREIIRFTCPAGVRGFDIAFKNSANGYKGRAYTHGTSYHWRWNAKKRKTVAPQYVVIGVSRLRSSRPWFAPYAFTDRGAYLGCVVYSNVEAIVSLVAHELRHLWQRNVKTGHRVWGSRGQYSERDADAYAIRMLRAWRRR